MRLQDLDFLFAGEKRDFAHLAEVHLDGVVQDVQAAFVFFLRFGLGFGALQIGRFDNLDLEAAQFGVNGVEEFGRDKLVGQGVVDVVVSEVALFLGQTEQFLDFFGNNGRIHGEGDMGDGDGGRGRLGRLQGSPGCGGAVFAGSSFAVRSGLEGKARFLGAFFQSGRRFGRYFSAVAPINSVSQHIKSDTFVKLRFIQTYGILADLKGTEPLFSSDALASEIRIRRPCRPRIHKLTYLSKEDRQIS